MIVDDLPDAVRVSLLAGYYFQDDAGDRDTVQAGQPDPEAFEHGYLLNLAMQYYRYADNWAEVRERGQAYDDVVAEINEKYGQIAIRNDEIVGGAMGFHARRFSPISTVETWERQEDGSTSHTVEDIRGRVAEEDAVRRAKREPGDTA